MWQLGNSSGSILWRETIEVMRSRSSSSFRGPSIRLFYSVGCVGAVTDRKPSPRVQIYVGFRIRTLALSRPADVISSVSERSEAVDPILERFKSLEIVSSFVISLFV
ncbi:hypothetical protein SDJN02_22936, partial [Cucurbita argyrosperma subsp. argyrosperma]